MSAELLAVALAVRRCDRLTEDEKLIVIDFPQVRRRAGPFFFPPPDRRRRGGSYYGHQNPSRQLGGGQPGKSRLFSWVLSRTPKFDEHKKI